MNDVRIKGMCVSVALGGSAANGSDAVPERGDELWDASKGRRAAQLGGGGRERPTREKAGQRKRGQRVSLFLSAFIPQAWTRRKAKDEAHADRVG